MGPEIPIDSNHGAGQVANPALSPTSARSIRPELAKQIDAIFADFSHLDTPGYALGIVMNDELIFAKGYGQANLDDGIPITSATAFHLASLSKQFTGAAVALLVLDGKLSFDDRVDKYIPEAAKFGPDLKIKHLVYMTSGIRDYTDRPRLSGQAWFSDFYFTRDEAIAAALKPAELDFAPGQQWSYSNVSYMLLTKVVEEISGQRFSEFMRRRVFSPLGMNDTHIDDDTTLIVPHRAIGYAPRSPEILDAANKVGFTMLPGTDYARMVRVSPHFGGSGVFSTLQDLARWNHNFEHPTLGGTALLALMQRREKFQHDKDNDALGLVYGRHENQPMWWYSGGDLDGSTYMVRFPNRHLTIICLSNILGGDCEGRSSKVLDIMFAHNVIASP